MQVKTFSSAVIVFMLAGGALCTPLVQASDTPTAEVKPKGESIDIDKLPKAIVDAVQKELPGARLTKAMKLEDGNYLLNDVKVGKKEYTIMVGADGKILKRDEDND